ncbi:MAG: tRNA (adenosine(37)-N6)-dimethylallyltransferase MiaA [Spirulina sp. SIO3F2]|nr:tRNA (adenosine(37)-N6)-dimethylallyltransferase MiaA [Spirulina sp. SIO3F2]
MNLSSYQPPGLIVICGPTASGKTGLSLALAQRLETCILSADSRQIYRELDIGTAKPTLAERSQAPHYLIDICDPTETLTLADYQSQAQVILAQQTQPPLLVGGTGLYVKAIARGLKIPRVPPQYSLRESLSGLGQTQCYAMLRQVDLAATEKIHPNDATRTLRALEVFYVTGIPISAQQGEEPPSYPVFYVGLDTEELGDRILSRTQMMVERGFEQEVAQLIEKYGADLPLLKTLGYAEMQRHLAGDWDLAETISQIATHTRQFAKRQRTWFRANSEIHWFDAQVPDLVEQVWAALPEWAIV